MLRAYLQWPFFDSEHVTLATDVDVWARDTCARPSLTDGRVALDARCRELVAALGAAGWTGYSVAGKHGRTTGFDVRSLALIRETLARHDALADFAFAMQGLGSGAISLAGSPESQDHYLPRVASGELIAAFALSEADAGSDVAALRSRAHREGSHYILDGEKTWISNGGIADFYCVFARTSDADIRPDGSVSARGISAFVVDAATPGLSISRSIDVI
jgi:acyl-CoA dehydrogenase